MQQPSMGIWLLVVAGAAVVVLVIALAFNGSSMDYWGTINVDTGTDVGPNQSSDTLTVQGQHGMMVIGDAGTDSISIGLPTPVSCGATGSQVVTLNWDADNAVYELSC